MKVSAPYFFTFGDKFPAFFPDTGWYGFFVLIYCWNQINMKTILLFGAGRSATVLIDYLLENAVSGNWQLILVDADLSLASSKIGPSLRGSPLSFNIQNEEERGTQIKQADLVISLLPPSLHIEVAKDCLKYHKHLLTASYVDPQIKALEKDIEKNKLLFIYEMGLDPGIDHECHAPL